MMRFGCLLCLFSVLFFSVPAFAATVDAGAGGFVELSSSFALDATIGGTYTTISWTKTSGPGVVVFSDPAIEDPTVTFSDQGKYILTLNVDGTTDTVTVYAYDSSTNQLLAHWDFDDVDTEVDVPDETGNGYDLVCAYSSVDSIAGYIEGSDLAADMTSNVSYWGVSSTTTPGSDAQDLTYGCTLAVWFKVGSMSTDFLRAISFENAALELTFRTSGLARFIKPNDAVYSTSAVDDDVWHHFVGIYDPANNSSRVYIDGVQENTGDGDIKEFSFNGGVTDSTIGSNTSGGKLFTGCIDDVKIYNYALTDAEVVNLFSTEVPFSVNAGADGFADVNTPYVMDGAVYGGGSVTLGWSKVSGPGNVSFTDPNIEDPNATFDAAGIYVLELAATNVGGTETDTVTIYVNDLASDQLLAHWDFDDVDTDPNIPDVTGNGYDGVCTISNPNSIDGFIYGSDGACNLDDPQAKWAIEDPCGMDSNTQDLTSGYTLSVWVKIPTAGVNDYDRAVYLKHNCIELTFMSDGRARWIKPSDAVYSTTGFNDDNWHHVVGVYDPNNDYSALYVDGVVEKTSDTDVCVFDFTGDASYGTVTADAYVGGKPASNDFDGALDDVRLYNYPMSQTDVEGLYASCLPLYADAGSNDFVTVGEQYALDGTVSSMTTPTLTWSKISGPGTVVFSDSNIEDPNVTCSTHGKYELQLLAEVGASSVSDTVKLYVYDDSYNQLLAHWDFDDVDTDADIPDVTGNGYDGVCTGSTATAIPGYIVGSDGACDLTSPRVKWAIDDPTGMDPNAQDLTFGYTLSTWLKIPVSGAGAFDRVVYLVADCVELTVRDQLARWIKPADAVYSVTTLNDNEWHHFVGVYDPMNNSCSLYIDGQLEESGDGDFREFAFTGDASWGSFTADAYIGGKPTSNDFDGAIDDVKLYNYAMDGSDIVDLYYAESPLVCQDIISAGYQMTADLNADCYVDWLDVKMLADVWLVSTNFDDFSDLAMSWQQCNDPNNSDCMITW